MPNLHQVRGLVGGDAGSNDASGDTSGTAQGDLGGNEDVGNVLQVVSDCDSAAGP